METPESNSLDNAGDPTWKDVGGYTDDEDNKLLQVEMIEEFARSRRESGSFSPSPVPIRATDRQLSLSFEEPVAESVAESVAEPETPERPAPRLGLRFLAAVLLISLLQYLVLCVELDYFNNLPLTKYVLEAMGLRTITIPAPIAPAQAQGFMDKMQWGYSSLVVHLRAMRDFALAPLSTPSKAAQVEALSLSPPLSPMSLYPPLPESMLEVRMRVSSAAEKYLGLKAMPLLQPTPTVYSPYNPFGLYSSYASYANSSYGPFAYWTHPSNGSTGAASAGARVGRGAGAGMEAPKMNVSDLASSLLMSFGPRSPRPPVTPTANSSYGPFAYWTHPSPHPSNATAPQPPSLYHFPQPLPLPFMAAGSLLLALVALVVLGLCGRFIGSGKTQSPQKQKRRSMSAMSPQLSVASVASSLTRSATSPPVEGEEEEDESSPIAEHTRSHLDTAYKVRSDNVADHTRLHESNLEGGIIDEHQDRLISAFEYRHHPEGTRASTRHSGVSVRSSSPLRQPRPDNRQSTRRKAYGVG